MHTGPVSDVGTSVTTQFKMSSCSSPKQSRHLASPLASPRTHYHFSPPSSKVSSPGRSTQPASSPPPNPTLKSAFLSDFNQHCRHIVDPEEPTLTYSEFEELLADLHFVGSAESRSDPCKVMMVRLWRLVKDEETGLASKELLRGALLEVVGVERMGLNVDLQREFRSLAVCRLKYLHLQEHALTQTTGVLSPQQPNRHPAAHHSSQHTPSRDKENLSKPMSPLRIPETKCPFVTVKVNLTPFKFDVINIYEGDKVEVLAQKFALKHELGVNGLKKLLGLMEMKLAELRRNKELARN